TSYIGGGTATLAHQQPAAISVGIYRVLRDLLPTSVAAITQATLIGIMLYRMQNLSPSSPLGFGVLLFYSIALSFQVNNYDLALLLIPLLLWGASFAECSLFVKAAFAVVVLLTAAHSVGVVSEQLLLPLAAVVL